MQEDLGRPGGLLGEPQAPAGLGHTASIPDADQLHILRHSLGLNYGDEIYRNHFCTNDGTVDWPHCIALVEAGLMARQKGGPLSGGDDVFFVTSEGEKVALASQPRMTPAQKRYRRWLDTADVTGQSFGEFLRAGVGK